MSNNQSINNFTYSGKVIHVGMPEQYTTKAGVTKSYRIIVMQTFIGNYPREVVFEASEYNMSQLNQITEDSWATVTFALSGQKTIRDGRAKWFPKLELLSVIKG